MPHVDVPTLGNLLLCAILVASGYTMMVSVGAARGRPQLTPAARQGVFATVALVAGAVFLLAYAFQSHDFRIRYIARYSDRSMSPLYLWTALWGGQDGSLLWWTFLLSGYTLAFTVWVKDRYRELQPYIYATLSSIFAFFAVLMLFAANPYSTSFATVAPPDGEGLNPLLQNYWMAIHPPTLYMGLTGWAIPFSICVAALFTGRLGDEWILAARRWTLLAWSFLSLGNLLGMFWSYEELGWGGYWAWDPVENASFMPWLLGTAFVHSVMIQERRGSLKVWNVCLMCGAFFMTIFGTFLTRSGLIASVHSFARSDIGIYFAWYMVFLAVALVLLISWRLPELRAKLIDADDVMDGSMPRILRIPLLPLMGIAKLVELVRMRVDPFTPPRTRPAEIESPLSREFAFLMNNWILLGMLLFILISTTFPLLSEALRDQTVTVGPAFYNRWMIPLALVLLFLMGVGPLIAWRKASGKNLREAFVGPSIAALLTCIAHASLGRLAGFPPTMESSDIYGTSTGAVLSFIGQFSPVACTTISAFAFWTVVQEMWRGTRVRMKNANEGFFTAYVTMFARARRRYGGYVVHLGILLLCMGFLGAAYDVEREGQLEPGESLEVSGVTVRYDGYREETDINREMLFADMTVLANGREIGHVSPAKFVYRTHPDMPTTEVAIDSGPLADLYVILSTIDPRTSNGTFRVLHRPLVFWIWFGGFIVLLGTFLSAFPSVREILGEPNEDRAPSRGLATAAATLLVVLGLAAGIGVVAVALGLLSPSPAHAQSDSSSTLHAGTVEIHDPMERQVFELLLCQCGDCARLPLSTCGCGWAENARAEVRDQIARGMDVAAIQTDYRERFGPASIAVPSDSGLDRALWAVPVALIAIALPALFFAVRRFGKRASSQPLPDASATAAPSRPELDARLEEELRNLDE
ncbi:MAG: cytochrome c biogenesis protein CcsA [Deltaproteobacteria bacterium]|nr:cytochrome c biogenesis protein CcsA [Deltaproteobacteria bacterium]